MRGATSASEDSFTSATIAPSTNTSVIPQGRKAASALNTVSWPGARNPRRTGTSTYKKDKIWVSGTSTAVKITSTASVA